MKFSSLRNSRQILYHGEQIICKIKTSVCAWKNEVFHVALRPQLQVP
jgi:hypothetical protein